MIFLKYILIGFFCVNYVQSEQTCCFSPFFGNCVDDGVNDSDCFLLNTFFSNNCFQCKEVDSLIIKLLEMENKNEDIDRKVLLKDFDLNDDEIHSKSIEEIISIIKEYQIEK